MARLTPTPHLLETIENQLEPKEAVSELIDNSIDAGATEVEVIFDKENFTISDNGAGVSDMNAPFRLGSSLSEGSKGKIGRYGYGGKAGLLHFGRKIALHTVHGGEYRKFTADFSAGWPEEYTGTAIHLPRFLGGISNGGSVFKVHQLTKGRRRIVLSSFVDDLSVRYFPALMAGKKITLANGKNETSVSLSADAIGLQNLKTAEGVAAGKPFSLYYGDPPQANKHTGRIHVDYQASRTLFSVNELPNKTFIHHRVYIRLTLGHQWSECLAPDKTHLCKHADELMEAVEAILRPWLEEFNTTFEELRVDLFHAKLSQKTPSFFAAEGAGFSRQEGHLKRHKTPEPPGQERKHRVNPDPDDKGGGIEEELPTCGVRYKRDGSLGECAARSVKDGNDIVVFLNDTIPLIAAAYEWPYKTKVLWPIIAQELAGFFRRAPEQRALLSRELKNSMGTDFAYGEAVEQKLYWWLLKQCPDLTESEISKAM
jgi:hypothetical protein